jgi:hypothetical protein
MTGETADISSLCEYKWFQWIWYCDINALYPNASKVLGRYLGPAKLIGPEMYVHILKSNGCVIQCTTIGSLTPAELENKAAKKQMQDFMTEIYQGPLGSSMTASDAANSGDDPHETPT